MSYCVVLKQKVVGGSVLPTLAFPNSCREKRSAQGRIFQQYWRDGSLAALLGASRADCGGTSSWASLFLSIQFQSGAAPHDSSGMIRRRNHLMNVPSDMSSAVMFGVFADVNIDLSSGGRSKIVVLDAVVSLLAQKSPLVIVREDPSKPSP